MKPSSRATTAAFKSNGIRRFQSTVSDFGRGGPPTRLQPRAQRYVADGYNVVVDSYLERFFDRVNHDILMSRVAARIASRYTGPPPRPLYGSLTLTDKSSHGWGSEHARLPAARRGC